MLWYKSLLQLLIISTFTMKLFIKQKTESFIYVIIGLFKLNYDLQFGTYQFQ